MKYHRSLLLFPFCFTVKDTTHYACNTPQQNQQSNPENNLVSGWQFIGKDGLKQDIKDSCYKHEASASGMHRNHIAFLEEKTRADFTAD